MCGVFGFISLHKESIRQERLEAIARVTESRGNHAWGIAWVDREGKIHSYKQPGPITQSLHLLKPLYDAVAFIGHTRWATHGSPKLNVNNHPHPCLDGWMVHNGVVVNYTSLCKKLGDRLQSECDSEVFTHLYANSQGDIAQRVSQTVNRTDGAGTLLGLWAGPARLMVARFGRPLHLSITGRGTYIASLSEGLPGNVRMMQDDHVAVFTRKKGKCVGTIQPLAIEEHNARSWSPSELFEVDDEGVGEDVEVEG